MADTGKITWTDWRGKEQVREVNYIIDIRDLKETPGAALLIMAANRHLTVRQLQDWMDRWGIERPESWISKRRGLFRDPNDPRRPGPKPNADGKDARAVAIMRENTRLSLRNLVRLLKENGIRREREWVRRHRCN